MSTQETAALIESVNNMTATVAGKMGQIDQRMNTAESDLNNWKATTSYVQKYYVGSPELANEAGRNTGNFNLIKLYTIKNATSAVNPWIHMGWTGGNVVGAGHFCSLAQSHAGYTGQQAMFPRRGNGVLRFFIDRTNQYNAPVYVAMRNESYNNAAVALNLESYMALGVEGMGAINIDTWLADNPNVVEITTLDITTQPAA